MTQENKILKALQYKPKTMLELSKMIGIERANICRRIADLEKENKVFLIGYGVCSISKHRAGIYTSDKKKANQIN